MKKYLLVLTSLFVFALCFTSCSEAAKVNYNIGKQADYFGSVRKITVYNTITDSVFMELEGCMSISNNDNGELVVTCKVGENQYKKNYIYLNNYVTYVVEDITGTYTDPYHYKWIINKHVLPTVDVEG